MRADIPLSHNESRLLKNILANVSLYRVLESDQLDKVVRASSILRPCSGKQILSKDDPAKGIYLVVYGQVKVYFDRKDGAERTIAILGHDHCFGLAEAVLERPHLASVEVISDAMIVLTPRETLFELAQENAVFGERLLGCVAHQMYRLLHDVKRQTLNTASERLAGFLLRQSEFQSNKTVELNASKTVIASKLGISSETFSRLLHAFSDQGLIEVQGRHIRILDDKAISGMQPV